MKKIIIFLILLFPLNVRAIDISSLSSQNIIIYDITENEMVLEYNSEERTSIASLTKIMTVINALENIEDLDEEVVITKNMLQGIYWNASKAGLKVGDIVTYRDLLYASMLPSGADATNSLAISISGSIENYVIEMNNFAKKIGMNNTNFVNVIGLDANNQYSSAKDLLILLKYALNNETFKKIYVTKKYTLSNGLEVLSTIDKFNEKMNLDISRIIGSKTGFTDDAGYCLSSLINSNNHELIIITLGALKINNEYYHIKDTLSLIDYIDEKFNSELVLEESVVENIVLINTTKNTNDTINYHNLVIVVLSLLAIIILLTFFCNSKKKRR